MKLIEVNENFLKQDTKFESSGNVRKEYHFLQVEKVEEVSNIQSFFETKTEDLDEPNWLRLYDNGPFVATRITRKW